MVSLMRRNRFPLTHVDETTPPPLWQYLVYAPAEEFAYHLVVVDIVDGAQEEVYIHRRRTERI